MCSDEEDGRLVCGRYEGSMVRTQKILKRSDSLPK